jgi:hypothetical protein
MAGTTGSRKRSAKLPPEPRVAAAYKIMSWLDSQFAECRSEQDQWELLGAVRVMVGQKPRQMDGVKYSEMRDFIDEFVDEWGVGN